MAAGDQSSYDLVLDFLRLTDVQQGWSLLVETKANQDKVIPIFDTIRSAPRPEKAEVPKGVVLADGEIILQAQELTAIAEALLPGENKKPYISVMGLFDRGKTFLLNNLSGVQLGSGQTINTRGISFKDPEKLHNTSKFLLVDTAGTNAPLDTESVNTVKLDNEEEMRAHARNLFPPTENTNEGRARAEAKVNAYIFEKKMEKAILNKKALEVFLQEAVFYLSDMMVVVVNEMTWIDQQYLKSLSTKLIDYIIEQARLEEVVTKSQTLIVVHNFKDTTTEEEFKKLRAKYVEECYHGNIFSDDITLPDGTVTKIERFENTKSDMVHFFLANEQSPAGMKYNPATYQAIRNRLSILHAAKPVSIFEQLADQAHKALSGFFQKVEGTIVTLTKDNQLLLKAYGNLKLLNEEVVYDGYYVTLARPSRFEPLVDQLAGDNDMVILVDLPGFNLGDMTVPKDKPNPYTKVYENNGCKISVTASLRRSELTIKGTRTCFFRQKFEEDGKLSNVAVTYSSRADPLHFGIERLERKDGSFLRVIKVPQRFRLQDLSQKVLENGVLQIVIPKQAGRTGKK